MSEFNKEYFQKMYGKDSNIDGDFNAREHAKYLKALFDLMEEDVDSLIDFGFGKGELLLQMTKAFQVERVEGLDVSSFAVEKLKARPCSEDWKLYKSEVHEARGKAVFDLGLSNSVLQYIEDKLVEPSVKKMAEKVRFLYFHVPTKEDYALFKRVLDFSDPYAKERPRAFYSNIVAKYFTVVAWGVLESKIHGKKGKGTPFSDSFYRF